MMRPLVLALLLLTWLTPAPAQDLRPFVRGSYDSIVAAHRGQPFILVLWSLDCVYCRDEFVMFGKLIRAYPSLDIVLVATDSPAQNGAIGAMLRRYHMQDRESWVFDDGFVERLRFEIDRRWHGELPRTYLFAVDGSREAVSGRLEQSRLLQWARRQTRHD